MRINGLADKRIVVTFTSLQDGTAKMTITYPREPVYRDRILGALSDILRREDVPQDNSQDVPDEVAA